MRTAVCFKEELMPLGRAGHVAVPELVRVASLTRNDCSLIFISQTQHWVWSNLFVPSLAIFDFNSMFVRVAIAVGGNVLVSVALNTQKLAHKRLESSEASSAGEQNGNGSASSSSSPPASPSTERTPLVAVAINPKLDTGRVSPPIMIVHVPDNARPIIKRQRSKRRRPAAVGRAYLHSKLWWFGLFMMMTGEVGQLLELRICPSICNASRNACSFWLAQLSLRGPSGPIPVAAHTLGTVALIANCFVAPLLLHERFRKSDLVCLGLFDFCPFGHLLLHLLRAESC